ncbi:MAG TPA: hypothetical protein VGK67_15190 [Myxococcales bacterium]|jgi:hypothetical protein
MLLDPQDRTAGGRLFSVGMGGIMLLVSSMLTWGAFFEQHSSELPALGYLLLVVVWSLTVHLLLSGFRQPLVRRLSAATSALAFVAFTVFIVWVAIQAASSPAETCARSGRYTFAVLVFFVAGCGVWLMASALLQQRRARLESKPPAPLAPGAVLFWPFLALAKAPLGTAVVGLALFGSAALGEWLGGRWGHPLTGAAAFLLVPIVVGVVLTGLAAARKVRGHT